MVCKVLVFTHLQMHRRPNTTWVHTILLTLQKIYACTHLHVFTCIYMQYMHKLLTLNAFFLFYFTDLNTAHVYLLFMHSIHGPIKNKRDAHEKQMCVSCFFAVMCMSPKKIPSAKPWKNLSKQHQFQKIFQLETRHMWTL